MTREEAKQATEVLKAFADGKKIEIACKGENDWAPLLFLDAPDMGFDFDENDYRIAKEPQSRPFETAEECWCEMLKHQPFGWVRRKTTLDMYNIWVVDSQEDGVRMNPTEYIIGFGELINYYTFADGEPFGIKIE